MLTHIIDSSFFFSLEHLVGAVLHHFPWCLPHIAFVQRRQKWVFTHSPLLSYAYKEDTTCYCKNIVQANDDDQYIAQTGYAQGLPNYSRTW